MWCTQALLPVLAASFHVSEARTGLTVTAPLIATAMAAPVVGLISDRFGRKKFILGATILLLLPTVLAALAGSFEALVVWRFVQGLLLPFIFTITIAYIGEETSGPVAARLAGTYMSGAIFGGFCGRLLAGMMTSWVGWRAAFWAIAGLTLVLAAIIAVMLPRERLFTPMYGLRRALRAFPLHLSNIRLLATCAVGFGVLFNLVAVFTFINFRLAAAPYFLGPAALGGDFRGVSGRGGDEPAGGEARQPVWPAAGDGGGGTPGMGRAGADPGGPALADRGWLAAGKLGDFHAADLGDSLCGRGGAGGEINRCGAVCGDLLYWRQRRGRGAGRDMARLWLAGMRCDCLRDAGDDAGGGVAPLAGGLSAPRGAPAPVLL